MEKIFNIKKFNIDELKKLRNILEKFKIDSFSIVDDNIKIVYDKERIKLNKKFYYKVELIRNKYYRQLLNIMNIIDNVKIYKRDTIIDTMDMDLLKISSGNYVDVFNMLLINYIGLYNFDNIFEVKKDKMIKTKKYVKKIHNIDNNTNNLNKNIEKISSALGMYCYYDEKLFELLESEISIKKLKECNSFILICPELIKEFCQRHFTVFKECHISNRNELEKIIFDKVLIHEMGHGVFNYIDDCKNEKRANYFVSITFEGTFDKIIKKMTDIQGEESEYYKNPLLITEVKEFSEVKKEIYNL